MIKQDSIGKFNEELQSRIITMPNMGKGKFPRLQKMVERYCPYEAAKKLIYSDNTTGYLTLYEADRLDLSVESLVLDYPDLFEEKDLNRCKRKLGRV